MENKTNKELENNRQTEDTMSRSEAGHIGGKAPHTCRGRECGSETSSSKESSKAENSYSDDSDHPCCC